MIAVPGSSQACKAKDGAKLSRTKITVTAVKKNSTVDCSAEEWASSIVASFCLKSSKVVIYKLAICSAQKGDKVAYAVAHSMCIV